MLNKCLLDTERQKEKTKGKWLDELTENEVLDVTAI